MENNLGFLSLVQARIKDMQVSRNMLPCSESVPSSTLSTLHYFITQRIKLILIVPHVSRQRVTTFQAWNNLKPVHVARLVDKLSL
jgi:hypothetical protein